MEKMKALTLPVLSEGMGEVVLCAWAVEAGQGFAPGDVLYEVEADKVVHQVEATEAGELVDQVAAEGDAVRVGDVLGHWRG